MEKTRVVEIISKFPSQKISRKKYAEFGLDVMGKLNINGRITVLFCGEEKMKKLNSYFLGRNYSTDVLSFPSNTDEGEIVNVGDAAICVKTAEKNAARFGVTLEAEIKKLMAHSFLHLRGYDHEIDGGKMARKEKSLLKALGVKY